MRHLLAAMRNPRDDAVFVRLLLSPLGRVSDRGLYELARFRRDRRERLKSLWEAAADPDLSMSDASDSRALRLCCAMLRHAVDSVGVQPLSVLLARAFAARDVDEYLLANPEEGAQGFAQVQQLCHLADSFQDGEGGPLDFIRYLDEQEELGTKLDTEVLAEAGEGCVRIMTVHAAKGLQFPVVALPCAGERSAAKASSDSVYVVDATDNAAGSSSRPTLGLKFPKLGTKKDGTDRSPAATAAIEQDKRADEAEKKRLFYVACTRAEEHLLISYAASGKGISGAIAAAVDSADLTVGDGSAGVDRGRFRVYLDIDTEPSPVYPIQDRLRAI
jgi:ATP-dependent helicase/nuclease subunit A